MANSLTAFSPTYWSAQIQKKLYKKNVFKAITSFSEQKSLSNGQTVNRPYRNDIYVGNYTKGTALTAQDVTGTQESLTVNQIKAALIYIDNVDKIQNKWSLANAYIDEASTRLGNAIDGALLAEVANAASSLDDADMGGTAGNGITLTTANILNVFGKANRKLDAKNVSRDNRFAVISPQFYDVMWQFIAGRESMLGDKTGENGHIGSYAGFDLYLSNNLYATAVLTGDGTITTTADAITIAGAGFSAITFAFVSTIGTTAGNVLIGATNFATYTNLAALINAGGLSSDSGVSNVSLSTLNQSIVQNWAATVAGSGNTATITFKVNGGSYLTLTATGVHPGTWTAATQLQSVLFGQKQATDMVIQQQPTVDTASTVAAGKWGMNILPITLFGVKTFNYGSNLLLNCKLRSDAY